MTTVNGKSRTTIVAWGFGRGLSIHNEVSPRADAAVMELIEDIELNDGVKVW